MPSRIEDRLRTLAEAPALEPDAAARQRTLTAMADAASGRGRVRFARAAAWLAVLGLTAVLGALALGPDRGDQAIEAAAVSAEIDEAYRIYAAQASSLERVLAEVPPQRQIMRAGTAVTIAGLEDQLALLDAELMRADGLELPGEYRAALMRDRVAVLSALVHVRYAQSYAFNY